MLDSITVTYLRRHTRPQQIMIKQIARPAKPTAITAATETNTNLMNRLRKHNIS